MPNPDLLLNYMKLPASHFGSSSQLNAIVPLQRDLSNGRVSHFKIHPLVTSQAGESTRTSADGIDPPALKQGTRQVKDLPSVEAAAQWVGRPPSTGPRAVTPQPPGVPSKVTVLVRTSGPWCLEPNNRNNAVNKTIQTPDKEHPQHGNTKQYEKQNNTDTDRQEQRNNKQTDIDRDEQHKQTQTTRTTPKKRVEKNINKPVHSEGMEVTTLFQFIEMEKVNFVFSKVESRWVIQLENTSKRFWK
jgi:hypothetical protein